MKEYLGVGAEIGFKAEGVDEGNIGADRVQRSALLLLLLHDVSYEE